MIKKIILVFKTHFDIGFTDLAENVIHSYGNDMLRQVIETCRATENLGKLRYVWTMPAWPLWHICSHCDPALKPELDRLIEKGQIVWHGLPFTTHTDFAAPEEYAETFRYSRELAKRYGKPAPVAAKMTDVPGHGLMLPELLDQAGIRFLHLGCNAFAMPPDVPELFFWQSPGGGRVLTMYSKGGYGTGLLPSAHWPYPVWMALMHTHDNCGPQSAQLIEKMARKARAACPDAEIVCGTMDDFYRELEQCDLSSVPMVTKDLADTWIHGVASYPAEVRRMRERRERSRRLHSRRFERWMGGAAEIPGLEALWDRYYEAAALFAEHTWGADVKTFLGPDRVYEKEEFLEAKKTAPYSFMERSWQEQRDRARQAEEALDEIEALLGGKEDAELPQESAEETPLRAVEDGGRLTVENHRYRLTVDTETGRIRSVYDRLQDAVILEAGEEGVFAYRYDRYGLRDVDEFLRRYGYHFTTWGIQDYGRENYPDCDHEVYYPVFQGWELRGRQLQLRYAAGRSSEAYGDGRGMCLTVEFPARGGELTVLFQLHDKQESPFIEAGSLVFPFAGRISCRIGKPGGVIDPETQIQRRCNHALFNLERQVTVRTDGGEVSICSPDVPLFGIGSPGVYAYHEAFGGERKPVLYFNLFNNMWGTNFPQWIGGSFQYRFLLRGGAAKPQVWASRLLRGETAFVPEGLELLDARTEADAMYILLRELNGREEERRLCLPGIEIRRVDLMRRPVSDWRRDSYSFRTRPYGVHGFALRRNTAGLPPAAGGASTF